MLDLRLLSAELDEHKEDIVEFEAEDKSLRQDYIDKLPALDSLGKDANDVLPDYSGCKILEEGPFIKRFERRLLTRAMATDWAMSILLHKTLAAVDGSQVYASRDISIPIGLAQAYAVLNKHEHGGRYETRSTLSLVVPGDFEDWGSAYAFARAPVDLRRHELECKMAEACVEEGICRMVYIDGSLVMSFINQVEESQRQKYAASMVRLLDASEKARIPVVAYTDMSMSKDILTMMRLYFKLRLTKNLTDAHLLDGRMEWGDRTRVFLSDRDDRDFKNHASVLDLYGRHKDAISFFYIRSSGGMPSKVEMPRWCYRMTDEIADVVRAQCIVRPGYPDIIHRAHEHVKINYSESRLFEEMLCAFARQHNVKVHRSAKEVNKQIGG